MSTPDFSRSACPTGERCMTRCTQCGQCRYADARSGVIQGDFHLPGCGGGKPEPKAHVGNFDFSKVEVLEVKPGGTIDASNPSAKFGQTDNG